MTSTRLTPFRQRVYEMTSQIPEGKVVTYGELARALQCRSPQAVGQALRVNPFAPQVPCHRVVSADASLGGFFGQSSGPQWERKRKLLEKEGVPFLGEKIAPHAFWFFD